MYFSQKFTIKEAIKHVYYGPYAKKLLGLYI